MSRRPHFLLVVGLAIELGGAVLEISARSPFVGAGVMLIGYLLIMAYIGWPAWFGR
jgi:predicted acyltransferase